MLISKKSRSCPVIKKPESLLEEVEARSKKASEL